MIASVMRSKQNSFKSNISYAVKPSHKESSTDTVVQLKSVALQNTETSNAFMQFRSGKDSELNLQSEVQG